MYHRSENAMNSPVSKVLNTRLPNSPQLNQKLQLPESLMNHLSLKMKT